MPTASATSPATSSSLAEQIDPADLVALDRVICCYADMAALVGRSAALARHRYGVVYLRDTWVGRLGVTLENAWLRLSRSPFRTYVHRTADVDAIVAAHGSSSGSTERR